MQPSVRSSLLGTALLVLAAASTAVGTEPFAVDRLYGEPSLIGTRPADVAWAPDSSRIAFTWNDAGGDFRDVWTWAPGSEAPQRLTRHGTPASASAPGEEGPTAEASGSGVRALAWLAGDPPRLVYVLGDALLLHPASAPAPRELVVAEGLRAPVPAPDGGALAYLTGEGLWLLPVPGSGERTRPRRLVATEDPALRIGSVHWSADGSRLAFELTDGEALPEREIHYHTAEGLQVSTVRRAFPGEPTARYRIGVVDVPSGMVRYLPRPEETDYVWNLGLSADGRRLFVNGSDPLLRHHRVDVYDVASGERVEYYGEHDPRHLRPDWRVAWAPADEGLVLLTDRDGFLHLYHVAGPDAEPRALTGGEWEIDAFEVVGDTIVFRANRDHFADRQLYRVPAAGGTIEALTDRHGTYEPFLAPDGRHAVALFSDDATPHDLYHLPLEAGGQDSMRRLTRSPRPDFAAVAWAEVRYLEFPSRTDAVTLHARLQVPPTFDPGRRYPLIVGSVYSDSVINQWGGRQAHPTWGLDQALVSRGYLLLAVNVRGSWGQGRAHNQGLRHGYGIVDIEDLESGVEHLVARGWVDPERVGIWGSSYGGLMTLMSLFKKPEIYAAGIAGAPATNVAHAYPAQRWVMGEATGDDQPGRYESQSPLYHSAGLSDPLMIIHGTRDPVVLYADTIALVEELIAREQPFELVTLPGVGHGWDAEAPAVRRFAFEKMIAFFERHLAAGEPTAASD